VRPLIAVPSYPRLAEGRVKGWHTDGVGVPVRYIESLRRAGGLEAIVMTESLDTHAVDDVLARVDGLLLLGGGDLAPSTYGEEAHTRVYGVSDARDEAELALTRAAIDRGLPVLAICRGHQVLNVALGGSLDQHIPDRPGVSEHGQPGAAGGALEHDVRVGTAHGSPPRSAPPAHARRAITIKPSTRPAPACGSSGVRTTA
jgi:gamma-glutamyl-gamma-aminobutyrate hydrolase PuuD